MKTKNEDCLVNVNVDPITDINFHQYVLNSAVNERCGWTEPYNVMLIKIQQDATVCRYLFTAKSLYIYISN